ncbi:HAD hydrolase domain-containing protein, family IA [Desulfonema limicola]|uniref:phosphoglycolate phosphatase n=1 Tax=Desulfonema limicola TaxID=45656 RepID=A0A975BC28_9BACT|nr:HAD-IA family hydrolase [Desulfonema limicola]QTA82621.1 HAD hydrolase domain-containing protein, family IA [Desulfonema limicola]
MIKNCKIIIFDCDGVMFDTADVNRMYYNKLLLHFKMPEMTDQQFAYAHMQTADESMAYLFPDKEMLKAAQAFRKSLNYADYTPFMEIEPFLKPLLKALRPFYKTAIATNRSDTMPRVMKEFGLQQYFDMVVTALDVKNPKPHPEELLKILSHFNLNPEQALYIGDSKADELAAKAAKVLFAAYNNVNLDADFHIKSLKEIKDILNITGKL